MYYVTCNRDVTSGVGSSAAVAQHVVTGDYSSKIEEIIRTVFGLLSEDDQVKIVIFANWDDILTVIGAALNENNIKFRQKSRPFHRSITDFKVGTK